MKNLRRGSLIFGFVVSLLLLTRSLRYSLEFIHGYGDLYASSFLLPKLASREGLPSLSRHSSQKETSHDEVVKHDNSSLPTFIWYRGKPFDPLKDKGEDQLGRTEGENNIRSVNSIVIDALSIGSHTNLHRLEGQVASWASHPSVRYLFGTTESDDADPTCSQRLTQRDFIEISNLCRRMTWHNHPSFKFLRMKFPVARWIRLQNKTIGWLCAQQRFPHSVGKIGRWYRREGNLPDYLFIGDDDTWYGVNQMLQYLDSVDPVMPFATAGCLVIWPVSFVNFSFPFGGYGTILNRKSLERLIRPIHCNTTDTDVHTKQVCDQIKMNMAGERVFFKNGMSVSDLMDRHAAMMPYTEYKTWMYKDPGYCMLGDWVLGYYVNYYFLGSPVADSKKLPYLLTNNDLGLIYYGPNGSCLNAGRKNCLQSQDRFLCHRLGPNAMREMWKLDEAKSRAKGGITQHKSILGYKDWVISSFSLPKLSWSEGLPSLSRYFSQIETSHDEVVKHDNSSLPTFIWYRGKPFNPLKDKGEDQPGRKEGENNIRSVNSIVIDALSIGSHTNLHRLEGQVASWASHPSVRYLFGTTESDDADPTCSQRLTQGDFLRISSRCRVSTWANYPQFKYLRNMFPIHKWIGLQNKTIGWLCAQQRFPHSVGKIGRWYRREGNLPDYLFIGDDDTWYGMNQMLQYLQSVDPAKPFVTVGCLVILPVGLVNFSFPYGGYGTILNRRSLERLIRPNYCNSTAIDEHMQHVCDQIKMNMAGERMFFQDGMSVSDLMDQHAAMTPYAGYENWRRKVPRYCMLGDWVLGYYTNYYRLGSPVAETKKLPYLHTDSQLGLNYEKRKRSCLNEGRENCLQSKDRFLCHRLDPNEMEEMSALDIENS